MTMKKFSCMCYILANKYHIESVEKLLNETDSHDVIDWRIVYKELPSLIANYLSNKLKENKKRKCSFLCAIYSLHANSKINVTYRIIQINVVNCANKCILFNNPCIFVLGAKNIGVCDQNVCMLSIV